MARVLSGTISNTEKISGDIRACGPPGKFVSKEALESIILVEVLSETANLLVEDNGVAKRFPVKNMGSGTVKSVNGMAPDEEGNVELYNPCDALELVTEMGLVSPVTDENGVVLTDGDGAIFTL